MSSGVASVPGLHFAAGPGPESPAADPQRQRPPGCGEDPRRLLAGAAPRAIAMDAADRGALPEAAGGEQQRGPTGGAAPGHRGGRPGRGLGLRRQGLVPVRLPDGAGATGADRLARPVGAKRPPQHQLAHHPIDVPHAVVGRTRTKRLRGLPERLHRHRCRTFLLEQPAGQTRPGLGLGLLPRADPCVFPPAGDGRQRIGRHGAAADRGRAQHSALDRCSRAAQQPRGSPPPGCIAGRRSC